MRVEKFVADRHSERLFCSDSGRSVKGKKYPPLPPGNTQRYLGLPERAAQDGSEKSFPSNWPATRSLGNEVRHRVEKEAAQRAVGSYLRRWELRETVW